MSGVARHGVGVVLGVVLGVVVWGPLLLGLAFGMEQVRRAALVSLGVGVRPEFWGGAVTLVGLGVVVGVLCGSRVSPLASLVPGVLNLLVAVVWLVDARAVYSLVFDFAPRRIGSGLVTVIGGGTLLLFGVLLVAASVPPSRWRAGVRAARPPLPGVPPIPFGGGAGAVPPPHVPGPAQPFAPGGEAPHAPSYGPAQGGPYGAGVPPEGPAPEGSRWMEPGKGER